MGKEREYEFTPANEIAKRLRIAKVTGRPWYGPGGSDYRDELLGDYTLDIAPRLPDSLAQALQANPRSGMRLKFRLKPDGVMFGWDMVSARGFIEADGDFQEALIFGGKVKVQGWELQLDGSRRPIDY
jgi:hypothetical protein